MKKRGFTMAETLITLGIIGVIAAIILPLINKIRPDDMKVGYLKAYDALSTSIKNISKSTIYGVVGSFENGDITADLTEFPLLNQSANRGTEHSGKSKFCKLIAESMGVTATDTQCPDTIDDYTDSLWDSSSNYFQTQNGMQWIIRQAAETPTKGTKNEEETEYTIDNIINNVYVRIKDGKKNCVYDSADSYCKKSPNIYKFAVGADGEVVPLDKRGAYYLATRHSWLKSDGERDAGKLAADRVILPIMSTKMKECLEKGEGYHWWHNIACKYCRPDWIWDDAPGSCTEPAQPDPEPEPEPEPEPTPDPTPDPTPQPTTFYFIFNTCKPGKGTYDSYSRVYLEKTNIYSKTSNKEYRLQLKANYNGTIYGGKKDGTRLLSTVSEWKDGTAAYAAQNFTDIELYVDAPEEGMAPFTSIHYSDSKIKSCNMKNNVTCSVSKRQVNNENEHKGSTYSLTIKGGGNGTDCANLKY